MNANHSEREVTYTAELRRDWGPGGPPFDMTMNDIVSLSIDMSCFSSGAGDGPRQFPIQVGQANSAEMTITVLDTVGDFYRGNLVYVKINGRSFGAYRVDKVSKNDEGTITVHGYDKLADTDNYKVTQMSGLGSRPTDITMLTTLCTFFNFQMDASVTNAVVNGYTISSSYHDVFCREMFAQIAAAYGGSFFLRTDDQGNTILCFVDLILPQETNFLVVYDRETDSFDSIVDSGGDRIIVP